MHCVADICVIPLTGRVSVRREVAMAHRVLEEAELKPHLHAYGTNVEGEMTVVLAAIETIHERLHAAGATRISTSIKIGTRTDKRPGLQAKIDAVRDELSEP